MYKAQFGRIKLNKFNLVRYQHKSQVEMLERPPLMRHLVFTAGVCVGSLTGCAIIQYERTKKKYEEPSWKLYKNRSDKLFKFRQKLNNWWNHLHEGEKVAAGIIGLNLLVFMAWRIPRNQYFMTKWFTSSTNFRASSPLLLSTFSHSEFWHIGANMFVLWSFAPLIQSLLGTEQFISFYLTGGTVSSLLSFYYKVSTRSRIPSLGASGALLAVLAACCIERPDARLSILFLPFFTFSAQTALYSIIAIDVTGLIMRWQLFDHAGHLGGTLFGSWYVLYGHKWTWDKRSPVIRYWHKLRKSLSID